MLHRLRSRKRALRLASGLVLLLVVSAASVAQARVERVLWTHPRSDVTGFEMRVRPLDGGSVETHDASVNAVNDIYTYDVEVGDADVAISMRAIGPGGELSAWTTEQTRLAPASSDPTVDPGPGTALPPTSGADARFDFGSVAPGTAIAGWVDTRANYSLSVDDSIFRVTAVGGNRMLHTDVTAFAVHTHMTGGNAAWSNASIRGRMAIDHPNAEIGITLYSEYPTNDAYYRIGRRDGEPIRFAARPGMSCSQDRSNLVPAAGDWLRFEIDVIDEGSQNRIRAKVWRQGDGEPADPQIECVDSRSDRPTEGAFGVFAGGPGNKYWDDLEIFQGESSGSGGGSPSPPAPPTLIQIIRVE